jgi:Zn-finger protein
MSYASWFQEHGEKHRKIIEKLSYLSDDELINYFRFENMVQNEPNFCPLYEQNKMCHESKELNCYFCACPNFRFNDKGLEKIEQKKLFSICSIDSKDGSQYISDNAIHQNCASCFVPHSETYIKKYFTRNWFDAMRNVRYIKK